MKDYYFNTHEISTLELCFMVEVPTMEDYRMLSCLLGYLVSYGQNPSQTILYTQALFDWTYTRSRFGTYNIQLINIQHRMLRPCETT